MLLNSSGSSSITVVEQTENALPPFVTVFVLGICSRFKAGVHLFTPLKIGLIKISRSRFKQYKNP